MDSASKAQELLGTAETLHAESKALVPQVVLAAETITEAFKAGRKVILFGNGGSAADAQHLAGEFVGKFRFDRPSLPAIALTTNSSTITAIANDYSYDLVFARAVEALVNQGDVVIALSTSGESPNVISGVEAAKKKGASCIGFCGARGRLAALCDIVLSVPSTDTPRIQEVHITLGHVICELVEETLFGRSRGDASGRVPRSRQHSDA